MLNSEDRSIIDKDKKEKLPAGGTGKRSKEAEMDREEKKERKRRSDAGMVMATRRDQYCIAWIAEQYAVRGDQLRRLLSRFPDPKRPFKEALIAETTVRDQISRWRRAGWIEYRRILADEPGYLWITRRGLQLVDLDEIYTARVPASVRLGHIYAINQVRLRLDSKYTWKSERRYRSELELKKSKDTPIPDALLTTKNGTVAVEVEISLKKPADLEAKLVHLVRHIVGKPTGGYQEAFAHIWFCVPSEKVKVLIEAARDKLQDKEKTRVSVAVQADLKASKFG